MVSVLVQLAVDVAVESYQLAAESVVGMGEEIKVDLKKQISNRNRRYCVAIEGKDSCESHCGTESDVGTVATTRPI
jgi:hypothetical protein